MKKKESALFFSYLCAHILQIAFLLLCFAIFAVILYLYDLPADPVLYAALLCAAVGLLSFVLSYLRFHKQFRRLESALLNLPESRDDLPEPSGSTAVCYDEAVRMLCTKLAQSETDRRRGQEENTDYFTMWVHQIKTPISAMRLMLGEEDTPRSRALSAELFRIDRYAEMALNYARLNSTSNDLVFAKVEVEPVIKRVVRQYAGQFVRKHIALKCDIAPVQVLTDEKWLAFILGQLLANAVKYTESGTVTVTVTKDKVLKVSDTGIGIAPEDLPRIFEKGFTGYNGRAEKKSTGLGMYLSRRAADMLGKPIEQLKLISCHLGNGSSVTAIEGGKSVDTSMGFTPLAGLPMGTRSGDIDAGILEYLMNKYGMDIKEMVNVLNKKSGVMGVSGVSSDFRDLEEAFEQGNERAGLAVDMFNYGVKKLIGAYAAAMGGVDAIIFTAGVGENSASQRMAIASDLEFMGVKMDEDANKVRGEERVISAPDSKVTVLLIPTNEELMIAMDTEALVG
jgi:signal transduction histidine kinase